MRKSLGGRSMTTKLNASKLWAKDLSNQIQASCYGLLLLCVHSNQCVFVLTACFINQIFLTL